MASGAEHHRPQITQGVVGYSKRVGFYYKLKVHYNFSLTQKYMLILVAK